MTLCRHKWEPRNVQRLMIGAPWTATEDLGPVTYILYVCNQCGNSKTEERRGHWSLADLKRKEGQ